MIAGGDRVETSVGVSGATLDSADTVILARADQFADALASSGLAAEVDGPVLLTDPTFLDGRVLDEIRRLGATKAYLAGGEAALAPAVQDALLDAGIQVERLAGASRFDTAILIAEEIVELGGLVDGVVVARADDFADALGGANLATYARTPIMLSDRDGVPQAVLDAIDELVAGPQPTAFVAGGTAALSAAVDADLATAGVTPVRVAGADRYDTARRFADAAVGATDATVNPTWLASGVNFPDALSAGVGAFFDGGVLLLVDPTSLANSPAVADHLDDNAQAIDRVVIAGGSAAVSPQVAQQVLDAIEG